MTRLLAIALVIVTMLPILIFATDFTNSRVLQTAREESLRRAGVTPKRSPEAGQVPKRKQGRRTRPRPTPLTVMTSMASYLVILTLMAIVGRRVFALRL
jgi:hypothetical protein